MCANNGRIAPDAAYVTRLCPSHVAHTASGAIPQYIIRGSDLIDIPSNDDDEDRKINHTGWSRENRTNFNAL